MRLIDADELAKKWTIASPEPYNTDAVEVLDSIREAPTVDAVVVTRCKDCKHLCVWNRKDMYAFCPKTNIAFLPFEQDTRTFFCGFGERKDGGNADENRDPENQG